MHKGIVLVTGVALKEASKEFKLSDSPIMEHKGFKCKMNAAAGTAIALNKAGYLVYMVGSCDDCLEKIGKEYLKEPYYYKEANVLKKDEVKNIVDEVAKIKEKTNLDVHLAHYGGASMSKVELPRGTVFLDPWETPTEAIAPIVEDMTVTWFNLLHALHPIFKQQDKSKVIFISAITALRTKRLHTLDAIQKGAGHAMARSLALDLTKENIFVTEIMPGVTDTGFYDNQATYDALILAAEEMGYKYSEDTFPAFSPERVGEAVVFAMDVGAHVRELSLMPYGQYPHLGA